VPTIRLPNPQIQQPLPAFHDRSVGTAPSLYADGAKRRSGCAFAHPTKDDYLVAVPTRERAMSDCLHCDINDLVRERMEQDTELNVAEAAAKVAESLIDVILLAPEEEHAKLMADVLGFFGQVFLEKTGAAPGDASSARH
jgi:hypothetical protein